MAANSREGTYRTNEIERTNTLKDKEEEVSHSPTKLIEISFPSFSKTEDASQATTENSKARVMYLHRSANKT